MRPLRELPSHPGAPIASSGVDTFKDWMKQQRAVDRSHRINTEELIKASHQAQLDRDEKLHERVAQLHAIRTKKVTKDVSELSGTQFDFS